jgi:hypothetical protein
MHCGQNILVPHCLIDKFALNIALTFKIRPLNRNSLKLIIILNLKNQPLI